jgi:hypothetical protein
MEHERGAFKVNSPDMLGAVKKSPETRSFQPPWRVSAVRQCQNFVLQN